ncbi:antibiotic ABC transporter [Paracoccus sp. DMF-8]|uniref:antibiotic ABC transporter n=1 Tax=Paracoccus sp. DMF-8 TaxID=3019445 RepID=UPI0023E7FD9F|nr:antibiotic ABC transporter [Paracoccus sp. DMF-8]MDF3605582.1 antibiotic ABC transporter [Paracoccus sp. DMF-8]
MKPGMFDPALMLAPLTIWRHVAQITWDLQMVIMMRTAGMMGLMRQDIMEPQRMVLEKADAAQEAMGAAISAAARGKRADQVLAAALRPYRRRTKANVRRLSGHRG